MKTLGQIGLALLAVGMIAAGMVSSFYIRKERDAITDQIQTLQTRVADMQISTVNMAREIDCLEIEIGVQSNRADVADAQRAIEKKTNEPLRRQIEQMMAERIDLESKQEQDRQQLEQRTEAYKKATGAVALLEQKNKDALKQFVDLKALHDAALLAQDAQAAQIKDLGAKLAGLDAELAATKTKLSEVETRLTASGVTIETLTQGVAAAQDQSKLLTAQLKETQTRAENAESKAAQEAQRARTAEEQATAHSTTVAKLTSDVAALTKQTADLVGQLNGQTARSAAAESKVAELQKQLDALTPVPAPVPAASPDHVPSPAPPAQPAATPVTPVAPVPVPEPVAPNPSSAAPMQ